jgi:DNA-binding NarL/FixJ family response regulator
MNSSTERMMGAGHQARKRLLLIEDDPVTSEILRLRISDACPLVMVTATSEPVAHAGYDIYVVDLNFAGRQEGVRLIESISATTPYASVFMLSSYLEVDALKRAMSVKCSGAFDKRNPDDVSALLRVISEVASQEPEARPGAPVARRSLIADMTALIREWNRRISAEQSRGS